MSENFQSENTLPPLNENNEERQYWKKEEEEILEEWADKAQCYEWMHHQTHAVYKKKKYILYNSSYYYFNGNWNCKFCTRTYSRRLYKYVCNDSR